MYKGFNVILCMSTYLWWVVRIEVVGYGSPVDVLEEFVEAGVR